VVLMHRLAVIGDIDSVVLFKAVGAEVFPVTSADEAGDVLVRLADEQYAIVCITEQFGDELLPLVERYSDRPAPAVVFIPSNKGSTGTGMARLREIVKKAVGADILLGKEGS
jgi:V/A-type H+-transporting ATPase subunit F